MTKNKLTKLIDKAQEKIVDEPRDYIGASSIGSDCLRQIWYEFKGEKYEEVPVKTRRTWAIGKHLEELVLNWLDKAGLHIQRDNFDLRSANVPYFRGHVDALWFYKSNKPVIIEIKTAKNGSYNVFIKKGLKLWDPQYYAQIQSYMGMSSIHSAYILVLNKDNSELSDESVTFDKEFYLKLEEKAAMIASAVVAPPKINGSPLWFYCKMCKFNKVCHK